MPIEINGSWLPILHNYWDIELRVADDAMKLKNIIRKYDKNDTEKYEMYNAYMKIVVMEEKVALNGNIISIVHYDYQFEYKTKTGNIKKSKVYPCSCYIDEWWWFKRKMEATEEDIRNNLIQLNFDKD